MDLLEAKTTFERSIERAEDLIALHVKSGQGQRGRRTVETSLNGAVIVLAVAAWQSAVENITLAALDLVAPASSGAVLRAHRTNVKKAVGDFSTPDAHKTSHLLGQVGVDVSVTWTWSQAGGQGRPKLTVSSDDAKAQLNEWLKVRHAIAHGNEALPRLVVLQSVKLGISNWILMNPSKSDAEAKSHLDGLQFKPTLRLDDARRCVKFIRRLVRISGGSVAQVVGAPNPWQ